MSHPDRVSPIEIVLRKHIANAPEKSTSGRLTVYKRAIAQTEQLPQGQRESALRQVKNIIAMIEAEYAQQSPQEGLPEVPVVTRSSDQDVRPQNESIFHEDAIQVDVDLSGENNSVLQKVPSGFLSKKLIAGCAVVLLTAVVFLFFFSQSNEEQETLASESTTSTVAGSSGTGSTAGKTVLFDFSFPSDLNKFDARRGRDEIVPDAIDENRTLIRFEDSFALIADEFIQVDPGKTYLGTAKFKLARKPEAGEKMPALYIGFRNFDETGRIMQAPSSFTAFVHSGRLRTDILSESDDGFFVAANLILPAGENAEQQFVEGATKFKPFITVNMDGVEIPMDISSFSLVEIE